MASLEAQGVFPQCLRESIRQGTAADFVQSYSRVRSLLLYTTLNLGEVDACGQESPSLCCMKGRTHTIHVYMDRMI